MKHTVTYLKKTAPELQDQAPFIEQYFRTEEEAVVWFLERQRVANEVVVEFDKEPNFRGEHLFGTGHKCVKCSVSIGADVRFTSCNERPYDEL